MCDYKAGNEDNLVYFCMSADIPSLTVFALFGLLLLVLLVLLLLLLLLLEMGVMSARPSRRTVFSLLTVLFCSSIVSTEANVVLPGLLQSEGHQIIKKVVLQKDNCLFLHLNQTRTCPHPVLYGRLSGSEVSVIEWESTPHVHDSMRGCWQVSQGGTFFLELILLRCERLQEDFTSQCLRLSTLTLPDAAIQVHEPVGNFATHVAIGKWVSTKEQNAPLHFRFQKPSCFDVYKNKARNTSKCNEEASLEQFSPYSWVWNDDYKPEYNKATTVCTIGDSHAGVLTFMPSHLPMHFKKVRFKESLWPLDLPKALDSKNPVCDIQVIQMGQWSASFKRGKKPQLVKEYAEEMASILVNFQNRSDILVLNVHYSPVAARASACPPIDWRAPDVLEAYNRALKQICLSYNIQYVDTNLDIILPLIDSGLDFCHWKYKEKVGMVEASFVARVINELVQKGVVGAHRQHAK